MKNISKCMTTKLITISEGSDLASAYKLMQLNSIRHLPVINKQEEIVGILSDRDLLRALKTEIIHQPGFKIENAKFDSTDIVYEYMSTPVKSFDKRVSLNQVLKEMIKDKISCYLISDEQKIVGIVTSENFLEMLLKYLENEEASSWSLERFLYTPWVQSATTSIGQAGI